MARPEHPPHAMPARSSEWLRYPLPTRSSDWLRRQEAQAISRNPQTATLQQEVSRIYDEQFRWAGQACRIVRNDTRVALGGRGCVVSAWPEGAYRSLLDVHGGLTSPNGFQTSSFHDLFDSFKSEAWVRMETQFLALQVASQCPATQERATRVESVCRRWMARRRYLVVLVLHARARWPRDIVSVVLAY